MFTSSYGPIIWRSLRSAHYQIRLQAARLFFDAFPFDCSASGGDVAESESLMAKQCEAAQELIKDPHPAVRALAGQQVCNSILKDCWEMLPTIFTRK